MSVPPDSPERKSAATPPEPTSHTVPKPDDTTGLKQFIKNLRRTAKRGADVNVANIGEGAQVDQIAVGRNILQAKINIGALVIPVRFLLALLAVGLMFAVGVWYVVTPDKMPTSGTAFNIAVADFGVQDAQGNVSSSAEASTWSKWMFDTLVNETAQLPTDLKIEIWHDSLRPLRERANIGLIQGKTLGERERAAEQKAKELNADLVIYGNFSATQNPGTFVPEFYLAKGRDEADEMRGSQAMGKPFELPTPLNPADQFTRKYLDKNLTPRAVALAWFVPGLIDDLTGDFEKAYEKFNAALTQLPDLQDGQGKAVFYYYLGRQALFLSQDENRARKFFGVTDPAQRGEEAALIRAEDAFRTAIALDAQYARAYFGLGSVFYQRANLILTNTFPEEREKRVDVPGLLEQAIASHQRALELAGNAPYSLIDIQSQLHLGFDYYQQGRFALDNQQYAEAVKSLRQAQRELEAGRNKMPPEQHRTLAQVYLALARTAAALAKASGREDKNAALENYTAASKAYDRCIAETVALTQDDYLRQLQTTCQVGKQEVQADMAKLN